MQTARVQHPCCLLRNNRNANGKGFTPPTLLGNDGNANGKGLTPLPLLGNSKGRNANGEGLKPLPLLGSTEMRMARVLNPCHCLDLPIVSKKNDATGRVASKKHNE